MGLYGFEEKKTEVNSSRITTSFANNNIININEARPSSNNNASGTTSFIEDCENKDSHSHWNYSNNGVEQQQQQQQQQQQLNHNQLEQQQQQTMSSGSTVVFPQPNANFPTIATFASPVPVPSGLVVSNTAAFPFTASHPATHVHTHNIHGHTHVHTHAHQQFPLQTATTAPAPTFALPHSNIAVPSTSTATSILHMGMHNDISNANANANVANVLNVQQQLQQHQTNALLGHGHILGTSQHNHPNPLFQMPMSIPMMAPLNTIPTTIPQSVPLPPLPNPKLGLTVQDRVNTKHVYNGVNPNFPNLKVLNQNPPVFAVKEFLSSTECDFLINVAQDCFSPAPVVGKGAGEVSPSRTSSTCYLAREDLPRYLAKVSSLTGKPIEHCELPQVGRYFPSQQYLQHFDAFDLSNEDGMRFASNGGQRTVTVLVYLNDVERGGHTWFPNLNLDVKPEKGMAVVFFPSTVDGLLDKNVLHAARPAVDTKYVSQVWIRQGRYEGLPSKRMFSSVDQALIVQKSLIVAREGKDVADDFGFMNNTGIVTATTGSGGFVG